MSIIYTQSDSKKYFLCMTCFHKLKGSYNSTFELDDSELMDTSFEDPDVISFDTYSNTIICPWCNAQELYSEMIEIDEDILNTIEILNKKGFKTVYCCSGHLDYRFMKSKNSGEKVYHSYPYIAFDLDAIQYKIIDVISCNYNFFDSNKSIMKFFRKYYSSSEYNLTLKFDELFDLPKHWKLGSNLESGNNIICINYDLNSNIRENINDISNDNFSFIMKYANKEIEEWATSLPDLNNKEEVLKYINYRINFQYI